MAKQTLGVFTENELDRNYMCKILSQVFSSSLDIVPVTLATPNKALLAKRILLCSLFAGKETG